MCPSQRRTGDVLPLRGRVPAPRDCSPGTQEGGVLHGQTCQPPPPATRSPSSSGSAISVGRQGRGSGAWGSTRAAPPRDWLRGGGRTAPPSASRRCQTLWDGQAVWGVGPRDAGCGGGWAKVWGKGADPALPQWHCVGGLWSGGGGAWFGTLGAPLQLGGCPLGAFRSVPPAWAAFARVDHRGHGCGRYLTSYIPYWLPTAPPPVRSDPCTII